MDNDLALVMDPFILLGWVNMKLRDEAPNLHDLCMTYGIDAERLAERLKSEGYVYNVKQNQFIGM